MYSLIVDPSTDFRRRVYDAVHRRGITRCAQAISGGEGLKMLDAHPVRIVFAGAHLGDMNGLTFVRHMRTRAAYKTTPLVYMSKKGASENVLEAVESGVDHYIVLPFDQGHLGDKVVKIVRDLRKADLQEKENASVDFF